MRDSDDTNSDTSNEITIKPSEVISVDPSDDGEEGDEVMVDDEERVEALISSVFSNIYDGFVEFEDFSEFFIWGVEVDTF